MEKLQLEYLKPAAARGYDFYLIPKLLLDHDAFDGIDYGAKLLYSLMLNRASLSAINAQDFTDKSGNLYIIYTVEKVMDNMRCSKPTAIKMLKQLEEIGLIERKRQGQGKPAIVYIKDFTGVYLLKSKSFTSRGKDNILQEVKDFDPNKNDINKNDSSNQSHCQTLGENITNRTNDNDESVQVYFERKKSPNNVPPLQGQEHLELTSKNLCEDYTICEKEIKNNIEYDIMLQNRKNDPEIVQELVNCMLDVICTSGETVRIGGEDKPRELVKSVYFQLRMDDIEHIIERYESVRHKITHFHSYLKTMLYTIRQEYGHYYTNAVRADGIV